jgi:hypothetical protein
MFHKLLSSTILAILVLAQGAVSAPQPGDVASLGMLHSPSVYHYDLTEVTCRSSEPPRTTQYLLCTRQKAR